MSLSRVLLTKRLPRVSSIEHMLLWISVASVLFGCNSHREVAVRVSIPNPDGVETPATGIGVVALPYNRDSVLASMESRARGPRPHTRQMDTLFARFRGPFLAYTAASYTATKLRDTLLQVRARSDSLQRGTPEYSRVQATIARLSDSLARVERREEKARIDLSRSRSEFVRQSQRLRPDIREWEDSTYHGWDSIVGGLAKARGLEPATDTTDATGWAHFTLRPGKWWIHARAWDTGDPNSEWYWNLPATKDTVLLSSRTGKTQPRY